jgi:hypothetical protein
VSGLSVSLVTYRPDFPLLERTLDTLRRSLEEARLQGVLDESLLRLIDNGGTAEETTRLQSLLASWHAAGLRGELITGHGNVGYGRGHNLGILRSEPLEFHLVLNPDIALERDAITQAIRFMRAHPDVGLLTPRVTGKDGSHDYLSRRYPSLLVLALRLLWPRTPVAFLRGLLARYEMRDVDWSGEVFDFPIATGCFMFFRSSVLRQLQGFSPDYFLYFEDYDLSLRAGARSRIAYSPAVRVQHFGGGAGGKGYRHIRMFCESAWKFFRTHGWKLA